MSPATGAQVSVNLGRATSPTILYDAAGNILLTETGTAAVRLGATGGSLGFYGTTPIALQTGVAVSAAGIHAALVALGLITA
jgi:streptogramin lyase